MEDDGSSSSSDESRSSFVSVEDPSAPGPSKRKRRAPHKTSKRKRHSEEVTVHNLMKEVSEVKRFLSSMIPYPHGPQQPMPGPPPSLLISDDRDDNISLNVSGELCSDNETRGANKAEPADLSINLPFNTTLKEPSVPKSAQDHVHFLNEVQHFGSPDWADVRYAEVQKSYCSTPGFIDTECNDELKPYDRNVSLSVTEKGFAAITQALIKQKESLQSGLESLLSWISSADQDITVAALREKLNEIFIEGPFNKISVDLLQMACGHRADLIQQRRDGILRYVKDKFTRAAIRKIPPTCEGLFDKGMLSAELEKNGGVAKTLWPLPNQTPKANWPAAQAGPSRARQPAQGSNNFPNTGYFGKPMPNPPAHGFPYYPPQGYFMNPFSQQAPFYMPQRFSQNRDGKQNRKVNRNRNGGFRCQ
ncbi:uncharacterized protein LOC125230322 [Leguminivora glycinivorella]|uniref:uncharacterized protein LOC125230322 n=1 Tax=Leguminivora glycinivorella TaxID=1035111 RepID=UPI00200FD6F7|nr:uncharacterized protein LOC125230322 [Leguminivora glycinivorella]